MFKKKRLVSLILALVLLFGATTTSLAKDNGEQDFEELNNEQIAQKIAEDLEFYFEKVGHITEDGKYEIVQDLEVSDFSRERMAATEKELREEREAVKHLLEK